MGDTLSLARLVDTSVLVIGSGLSDRRMVTWTKQLLTNVHADIAGAVLNFAPNVGKSGVYYYYGSGTREEGRSKSIRSRG